MKTTLFAAGLLALAACVTRKDLKALPLDSGLRATYKAPFDKVRAAVRDAFGEAGFKQKEPDSQVDLSRLMMVYSHGVTASHSPRWARAVVEKAGEETHVNLVVWSKVESRDAETHDTAAAEDLHKRIEKRAK